MGISGEDVGVGFSIQLLFRILAVIGLLMSGVVWAEPTQSRHRWVAFGDLRGHLEPCGCDPSTDLGSVRRLNFYLSRERKLYPDLTVVSLGNYFSITQSDLAKRKNKSISQAISLVAPDVSLLNETELRFLDYFKPIKNSVLSNSSSELRTKYQIPQFVTVRNVTYFGFVETSILKNMVTELTADLVKSIVNKQHQKGVTRIALYSGTDRGLKILIASRLFDDIIVSNLSPLDEEYSDKEVRAPERLRLFDQEGQIIRQVPLGGAGVLRSPSLFSSRPAESLQKVFESKACLFPSKCDASKPPSHEFSVLSSQPTFDLVWLTKDYESKESSPIEEIMTSYREASSDSYKKIISEKLDYRKSHAPAYVGQASCEACHAEATKKWQDSKHAKAFDTLEAKGVTKDPECVSCHVSGFKDKDGFIDAVHTPELKHVGCESCHGPRRDHIVTGKALKFDAKTSCQSCHTQPHSPKFDYKIYWEKIKHK